MNGTVSTVNERRKRRTSSRNGAFTATVDKRAIQPTKPSGTNDAQGATNRNETRSSFKKRVQVRHDRCASRSFAVAFARSRCVHREPNANRLLRRYLVESDNAVVEALPGRREAGAVRAQDVAVLAALERHGRRGTRRPRHFVLTGAGRAERRGFRLIDQSLAVRGGAAATAARRRHDHHRLLLCFVVIHLRLFSIASLPIGRFC